MKWLRFRVGGRERFGVLDGEKVQAYEGEMFGEKHASGEEFAVDAIEWLTPAQPAKMILSRPMRSDSHPKKMKNGVPSTREMAIKV